MTQANNGKRGLIVGSDPMLLSTRRDVLEANGIAADTRLLRSDPQSLSLSGAAFVIACSSLTADARKIVITSSRSSSPKILCLVVHPGFGDEAETSNADAVIGAMDGPRKFVRCVQEMISQ